MKKKLITIISARTVKGNAAHVLPATETRCFAYQPLTTILACLVLLQFTAWSHAFEQHEAHEHGVAQLNIVKEGASLIIALETPAANILGFEHQPSTEQQKQTAAEAKEILNSPEKLFTLPQAASCRLTESGLEAEVLAGVDEHSGHADHHEDDHKQHHDGHHDDKHQHDEEHAGGDEAREHDHDTHADEHSHSDIDVQYTFVCEDPAKLTNVEVLLFETFSGFEEIDSQIISDKGQQAVELTPANTIISL